MSISLYHVLSERGQLFCCAAVRDHSAHPNKVSFLSLLPVPPLNRSVPSLWWAPQPGTAFLLNFAFLAEPLRLRFFLTLRLLCLTVLVLGALLSSFLGGAVYKCSIWKKERKEMKYWFGYNI